jgi:hypothetical protein
MRYANKIAAAAHVEMMRAARPDMMEYQLEAAFMSRWVWKGVARLHRASAGHGGVPPYQLEAALLSRWGAAVWWAAGSTAAAVPQQLRWRCSMLLSATAPLPQDATTPAPHCLPACSCCNAVPRDT